MLRVHKLLAPCMRKVDSCSMLYKLLLQLLTKEMIMLRKKPCNAMQNARNVVIQKTGNIFKN